MVYIFVLIVSHKALFYHSLHYWKRSKKGASITMFQHFKHQISVIEQELKLSKWSNPANTRSFLHHLHLFFRTKLKFKKNMVQITVPRQLYTSKHDYMYLWICTKSTLFTYIAIGGTAVILHWSEYSKAREKRKYKQMYAMLYWTKCWLCESSTWKAAAIRHINPVKEWIF